MRTGIRDVARHANVSPMTVSNVLRGRTGEVSSTTRERVLNSIRELNYVPLNSAVQNRHVETRTIGVVFDDLDAGTDIWGLLTFQGIRAAATRLKYDLLVMLRPAPDWAVGREEAQYLDRRTDGLIFVAPRGRDKALQTVVEHHIPIVATHHGDVPGGVARVTSDDRAAGRLATEHLIARGHAVIAYLEVDPSKPYFRERRAGYDAAMREARLEANYLTPQNCWFEGEAFATEAQCAFDKGMTALVCANDGWALAVWDWLEERGLQVPGDLSLVGCDNLSVAAGRGLTTIDIDSPSIGAGAVDTLRDLLAGLDWTQCCHTVPVRLIERSSVATRGDAH